MNGYAPGSQLAQVRDMSASAQLAYSAAAQTEVQHIVVCNTTGALARFSVYHDDGGNRYSAGTALFLDTEVAGRQTVLISADDYGTGITLKQGGSLGVRGDVTAALTFTIYGTTRLGR